MIRLIAVSRGRLEPELLDQAKYAPIFEMACRVGMALPRVKAAGMDLQKRAETPHRGLLSVSLDKGGIQSGWLAKYAAAFFRLSRSSVTRFNSLP